VTEQAERMKAVIGRLTYKPTWRFTVEQGEKRAWEAPSWRDGLTFTVWLTHEERDVVTGRMECFTWRHVFDVEAVARMPEEHLVEELRRLVIRGELHDVDEWLKLDGVCVVEPHPERA
jgi:hypothetical protein